MCPVLVLYITGHYGDIAGHYGGCKLLCKPSAQNGDKEPSAQNGDKEQKYFTVSDECSNAKRQKCESNPLYDILRKDIDAYLGEEWPQWRGGG